MLHHAALSILMLTTFGAVGSDKPVADFTVVVTGIRQSQGELHVNVCREQEFLTPSCYRKANRRAHADEPMRFTFRSVAPGSYAIQVIHDTNDNGRFDQNVYGAPAEPNGVSRNPSVSMRAPTFRESAVHFDGSAMTIQVHIE